MDMYVVAIYDLRVGVFSRPVFMRSRGEALRGFEMEVRRVDGEELSALQSHPKDFQLFHLGVFDDSTGRFLCPDVPEKLADGGEVAIPF